MTRANPKTCCACYLAVALVLSLLLLSACGVQVDGRMSHVARVRFDDDKVTCYTLDRAISCLRDAP